MKVVIFAGGVGTRISEESHLRPKPMIEIGGQPIIWHIMKIYESHGFNDFIVCLGYKGYLIKEYFMNYFIHNSDVTINIKNNSLKVHQTNTESFTITLVDTGLNTKTAGRLKRIKKYVEGETFMLTYGDAVTDLNLTKVLEFHKKHGKTATVTSVQPAGKFGSLEIQNNGDVSKFMEKPKGDGLWINGGFFVLQPGVFDFLNGDMDGIMWEEYPLTEITRKRQLVAYKHEGFWKCMDAMRDKIELDQLWEAGIAKWKTWK
ncbi:MAG: glucose-1-phosphate cytidylyltransferase [Bacteroidetes bacterium]|nr:glucose-1-phosphate cytidylyltransferase [Bacteroidota bacterium]